MNGDPFFRTFDKRVHNSTLLNRGLEGWLPNPIPLCFWGESFCWNQWRLGEKQAALWELLAETLWECDWSDLGVKMRIVTNCLSGNLIVVWCWIHLSICSKFKVNLMLCRFYTVNFHLISDAAVGRRNLGHCLSDFFSALPGVIRKHRCTTAHTHTHQPIYCLGNMSLECLNNCMLHLGISQHEFQSWLQHVAEGFVVVLTLCQKYTMNYLISLIHAQMNEHNNVQQALGLFMGFSHVTFLLRPPSLGPCVASPWWS